MSRCDHIWNQSCVCYKRKNTNNSRNLSMSASHPHWLNHLKINVCHEKILILSIINRVILFTLYTLYHCINRGEGTSCKPSYQIQGKFKESKKIFFSPEQRHTGRCWSLLFCDQCNKKKPQNNWITMCSNKKHSHWTFYSDMVELSLCRRWRPQFLLAREMLLSFFGWFNGSSGVWLLVTRPFPNRTDMSLER